MSYSIEPMNGYYRVYRNGAIRAGIKTFKTARGAKNFIRRLEGAK